MNTDEIRQHPKYLNTQLLCWPFEQIKFHGAFATSNDTVPILSSVNCALKMPSNLFLGFLFSFINSLTEGF